MRVGAAARYVGVHPQTLRRWQAEGRIAAERVNARGDRRFRRSELDRLKGKPGPADERVGLYVRVSGSTGQESSLAAQEAQLRALCGAAASVRVFKDRASGLNERRAGLRGLLRAASRGELSVVRVTHRDRLTRFGFGHIEQLLGAYGVRLEVLHEDAEQSVEGELLADFMSLIACFSGRLYGQRSAAARARLLQTVSSEPAGSVRP